MFDSTIDDDVDVDVVVGADAVVVRLFFLNISETRKLFRDNYFLY